MSLSRVHPVIPVSITTSLPPVLPAHPGLTLMESKVINRPNILRRTYETWSFQKHEHHFNYIAKDIKHGLCVICSMPALSSWHGACPRVWVQVVERAACQHEVILLQRGQQQLRWLEWWEITQERCGMLQHMIVMLVFAARCRCCVTDNTNWLFCTF